MRLSASSSAGKARTHSTSEPTSTLFDSPAEQLAAWVRLADPPLLQYPGGSNVVSVGLGDDRPRALREGPGNQGAHRFRGESSPLMAWQDTIPDSATPWASGRP